MEPEEKGEALHDFTIESLTEILDAGVDVGMVQIGNEINNGLSGEKDPITIMRRCWKNTKWIMMSWDCLTIRTGTEPWKICRKW